MVPTLPPREFRSNRCPAEDGDGGAVTPGGRHQCAPTWTTPAGGVSEFSPQITTRFTDLALKMWTSWPRVTGPSAPRFRRWLLLPQKTAAHSIVLPQGLGQRRRPKAASQRGRGESGFGAVPASPAQKGNHEPADRPASGGDGPTRPRGLTCGGVGDLAVAVLHALHGAGGRGGPGEGVLAVLHRADEHGPGVLRSKDREPLTARARHLYAAGATRGWCGRGGLIWQSEVGTCSPDAPAAPAETREGRAGAPAAGNAPGARKSPDPRAQDGGWGQR